MDTKHIFISGRVQGVGFRFHTQRYANNNGLRGWVRNLVDGRVEILAQGSEKQMKGFIQWIGAGGPPNGQVDEMKIESSVVEVGENCFSIRETGSVDG